MLDDRGKTACDLVCVATPKPATPAAILSGLTSIAKQLPRTKTTYIEIDPHALTSSALGRSQQAVAKLFEQTIPELAMDGAAIVLLDELETLAVSRHHLSLEANPIDVHRATDAALAGMDRLTRDHRNVLLIGTTNFPKALDRAVILKAMSSMRKEARQRASAPLPIGRWRTPYSPTMVSGCTLFRVRKTERWRLGGCRHPEA